MTQTYDINFDWDKNYLLKVDLEVLVLIHHIGS